MPNRPALPRRVAAALAVAVLGALLVATPAQAAPGGRPDLGPNVVVFDPGMTTAQIKAKADAVAAAQVANQFGTQRYALLFLPGNYGSTADPLVFQVGYYTEVAGLGASPSDVHIVGHVDVYNQCDASGCIALNNFWRSISNLTLDVAGETGCRATAEFWAVSQASPMRRVDVNGPLSFMDYCTAGPQFASGGFLADSRTQGVVNGSQQQFVVRDSAIGSWSNGVWNQVFSGVQGAPAQSFGQPGANPYTTLATTPVSKEKPYLYVDAAGRWLVRVPAARTASSGTTWAGGLTPGRSIPLSDFVIARPGDPLAKINSALAQGRDLLLTPGVYDVDRTIAVKRAGTVVLGLGMATLTAQGGQVAMAVADEPGIDVAGVTFDAGAVTSPVLLQVGDDHGRHRGRAGSSAADPIALQDVFFRIGGPHAGRAAVSLRVDADHAVLDDIWAWRADHGDGVGWTVNTAANGVLVTGDDVTATGLFVEHYQQYNVVWTGERGRTVFFQNELPYDAPDQAAWSHDGVDGWAAYKVGDRVRDHEAWGLGSYIFTNVNPTLHATNAFEVPVTPGVRMHDLLTVSLNGAGTIDHVINGVGAAVTPTRAGPEDVIAYP